MSTTPERWRRFEELFLEAQGLEGEELASFLRSVGEAHDEDLAAELERALQVSDDTTFLEPPPMAGGDVSAPVGDLAGKMVGTARLMHPLGEGGMGVVFMGVQPELGRRVAVKLLKGAVSADARRRFSYEARLLAGLDHPGIASVLESGVIDGPAGPLPWFTMEFVEGARPIDRYAAEERLDSAQRLELIADACEAVGYAHDRGIIHRDLKPANLLVDVHGRPKVIDFGVARGIEDETDRPFQTITGGAVGTLRYMSPEQAEGRRDAIDVRTDVYAMGVILYQLVCGRHPLFESGEEPTMSEALAAIREREPARPSRVVDELHPDIEAIVLTALRKDQTQRYESIHAFARDLRAHLAGDLIAARTPSRYERVRHVIRRNRVWAAAIAVAVLALIAGGVVATVFAIEANAARASEKERADEAERRLGETSEFTRWIVHDLQTRMSSVPGTLALREELLSRVVDHLDAVARGSRDPDVWLAIGEGYMTAGVVQGSPSFRSLGRLGEAITTLEKAEAMFAKVLADDPTDRNAFRFHVLCSLMQADIHNAAGRFDVAEELYARALASVEPELAEHPDDEGFLRSVQRGRRGLSLLARMRGDHEVMIREARRSVEVCRRLSRLLPDDDQVQQYAAAELIAFAGDLRLAGRLEESRSVLEEAGTLIEDREVDDGLTEATIYRALADIDDQEGDVPSALLNYRKSERILTKLHEQAKDDTTLAHHLSVALVGIGNMCWRSGDGASAEVAFVRNLEIRRMLSKDPTVEHRFDLAFGLIKLGSLRLGRRDFDEAIPLLDEAAPIVEELLERTPTLVLPLAIDLQKQRGHVQRMYADGGADGVTRAERRQYLENAVAEYKAVLALITKYHPTDPPARFVRVRKQVQGWIDSIEKRLGR